MSERRPRLYFFIKRGWLYVRGLIKFGPVRTLRGGTSVRMVLNAFEHLYGRLPNDDEKLRLVQKLSWFDQHYQRVPKHEEIVQMIQQLELR